MSLRGPLHGAVEARRALLWQERDGKVLPHLGKALNLSMGTGKVGAE